MTDGRLWCPDVEDWCVLDTYAYSFLDIAGFLVVCFVHCCRYRCRMPSYSLCRLYHYVYARVRGIAHGGTRSSWQDRRKHWCLGA